MAANLGSTHNVPSWASPGKLSIAHALAARTGGRIPIDEYPRYLLISTFKSALYGLAGGGTVALGEAALKYLLESSTPTPILFSMLSGVLLASAINTGVNSKYWPEISGVLGTVAVIGIRIIQS